MTYPSTSFSPSRIHLATAGVWSLHDLRDTLDAIELLYGIFLVLGSDTRVTDKSLPAYRDTWQLRSAAIFLALGYDREWLARREIRTLFFYDSPVDLRGGFSRLLRAVFEQHPSIALIVRDIHMASPGGFTLEGLGEPSREVRELIKDFWYRNRQESALGDIAIQAARVRLGQLEAPPATLDRTTVGELLLADGLEYLTKQHDSGKLPLDVFTQELP